MKYSNIREEALKNKVAQDFFDRFDCTEIIKDIDFAVRLKRSANVIDFNDEYLLWAEAKAASTDILIMLTQLVLTIGKARMFDKILPPPFLGCFDCGKIAFVPYADIQNVFYQNDFNWKITPSDHETREFKQVYAHIKEIVDNDIPYKTYLFDFEKDGKDLKQFVRENFIVGKSGTTKIRIDKNNFIIIYNKWLETVKPTIQISDWEKAKKLGIIDGDFYLADLLSQDNKTLKDKLFVLLKSDHYELDRRVSQIGTFEFMQTGFADNQKAHTQFWAKYERPPLEEYWDYIIERRDLLVPQDVRERKGSFFTPKIWVELSQKYLADVLGEDWQEEYYVWDCAAGTGNLLAGLTNKYNIWASTLDKADVDVMKDRIRNGANLLEDHVFQFDFLNDEFTKLPQSLQNIINDSEKRKKLVVYINPPYAEATSSKTISNVDSLHKKSVANSKIKEKYESMLNQASKELFVQFLFRIYKELQGCHIANFSKVKILQGSHYKEFREHFSAKLEKMFIVPSYTFDNVTGKFPIGFFIWNTQIELPFESVNADIYEQDIASIGQKTMFVSPDKNIKDWLRKYNTKKDSIAYLVRGSADIQNNNVVFITLKPSESVLKASNANKISKDNLIENAIFISVRKVIEQTWINDRDQYLYPNPKWEDDGEFKSDCLAFMLFEQSNNVKSSEGTNHWIPFTESEVDSREKFDSNFMTDFMAGKIKQEQTTDLFSGVQQEGQRTVLVFSTEAQAVFDAGRKLWKYYHAQTKCNVNASLYDIREHFQGRNDKGKMNNRSDNETYNELIGNLRLALKTLAKKMEPKVYEYGFLKE